MIWLRCTKEGAYFTKGMTYAPQEDEFGLKYTYDDDGDYHEFEFASDVWCPCGDTKAKFEEVYEIDKPRAFIIEDTQRLEELTEWCRNKPEEAAVRIMTAERN